MRLCRDKDCLRYGIALNDDEFGRNDYYLTRGLKDGKHIYCKKCCLRRTNEYRAALQRIAVYARLPKEAVRLGFRR